MRLRFCKNIGCISLTEWNAALILNASTATMVMAWQVAANLLEGSETNLDYGFSFHHSGHLTLWGVRVAFMIMR
jgi:hypothetical protein